MYVKSSLIPRLLACRGRAWVRVYHRVYLPSLKLYCTKLAGRECCCYILVYCCCCCLHVDQCENISAVYVIQVNNVRGISSNLTALPDSWPLITLYDSPPRSAHADAKGIMQLIRQVH